MTVDEVIESADTLRKKAKKILKGHPELKDINKGLKDNFGNQWNYVIDDILRTDNVTDEMQEFINELLMHVYNYRSSEAKPFDLTEVINWVAKYTKSKELVDQICNETLPLIDNMKEEEDFLGRVQKPMKGLMTIYLASAYFILGENSKVEELYKQALNLSSADGELQQIETYYQDNCK